MRPETRLRIDDRIALVTGASRGIGAATADWLRSLGADVFGTATSGAGAERISERLGEGEGWYSMLQTATPLPAAST